MVNNFIFIPFFENVIKYRWRYIIALAILFFGSLYLIGTKLEVDNSLKIWFLEGDQTYQKYLDYQKNQGSDEIIVVMLPSGDSTIYSREYIDKLHRIHSGIDSMNFVESTYSLYKAEYPLLSISGLKFRKLFSEKNSLEKGKKKLDKYSSFKSYIVSKDEKSSLLYIQLKPTLEIEKERNIILDTIKTELSKEFKDYYMSGIPVLNEGANKSIRKESKLFSLITILFILLLLYIYLPNGYYMPIAFIAIVLPIAYLFGIYILLGIKLNLISMILPTILMVYGLANVVHILNNYHFQKSNNPDLDRNKNIVLGLQRSLKPCFYTTITTMVGYMALYFSLLSALRITGIFATLGLAIAFVTVYIVVAIGLYYLEKKNYSKTNNTSIVKKIKLNSLIAVVNNFTDKYPKPIIAFSVLVFLFGAYSVTQINIETNVLRLMGNGKEKKDYQVIEKNHGGLLRFDINIYTTDSSSILDSKKLKKIALFENKLIEEKVFPGFISVNSLKSKIEKEAKALFVINPNLKKKLISDLKKLNRSKKSYFYLLNDDFTKMNLITSTKISSTKTIRRNLQRVNDIFKETVPKDMNLKLEVEGYSPLYVKMNEYIYTSQLNSFGAAFLFTFLFLVFWIKRSRLSIIALYPNILPLLMIAIVLVLFGINLESSTIMIAPIMLGIAMDDTIHLIHKYQEYRKENFNKNQSINMALLYTGKAIFLTSLALSLGFLIISFSSVQSIKSFGLLSSLTIVFAFIADIIVLPSLIKVFDK